MESDTEKTSKDYELFHHGVLGMKWGIRRPVGPDGLIIKGGKGSGKSRKGSTSSGGSSSSKSSTRTITSTASKKKKAESEANKSSGIEDSKASKSSESEDSKNEDSSSNSNSGQSQESQRASELLRRDPMTLSNTEIRELTQRLSLEADYNRLTTPGPQKNALDRGHDVVKKGMDFGRTALTLYQMYNHPATKAGLKVLKGLIEKAADIKLPNKPGPRLDPTPWKR